MKKYISVFVTCSILLCLYACTHKTVVLPHSLTKDTTVIVPPKDTLAADTTQQREDTSVCFQRDVLPIFLGSCAKSGCHDAATRAKGYNLTSYSSIMETGIARFNPPGSPLYSYCANGKMPKAPTPKLDSAQLAFIWIWIAKGAPDDIDCAVVCDTTKFTYTNAIVPILTGNCYTCHATAPAASSGGGIVLDNYNAVLTQVQNGKLLGDLQQSNGFNYMPLGGIKLSDCKIIQVSKWIQAGALNN